MKAETVFLSEMTNRELEKFLKKNNTILIPTGSTEQHDAHSPLCTDILIPQELCRRVAGQVGAVVAPSLAYFLTNSGGIYRMSKNGTWGDGTRATAEKGRRFLDWAAESVPALLEDVDRTFEQLPVR